MKEKRTESGYTMAQMASMLNITESYYSLIEGGDRQKKMDMLLAGKLSVIFNIPIGQIAEYENN